MEEAQFPHSETYLFFPCYFGEMLHLHFSYDTVIKVIVQKRDKQHILAGISLEVLF